MNKYTLIEIGLFVLLGIYTVSHFMKMRAMRSKFTRQLLFPCVGQLVAWTLFGGFLFSGLIAVFYFASIAAIFVRLSFGSSDCLKLTMWPNEQR